MSEVTVTLVYSGGAELQQTINDSAYSAFWKNVRLVSLSNIEVKQFSDLVNGAKYLLMEQQPGNAAASALTPQQLLQTARFDPTSLHHYEQFEPDGFGPFVVKREKLIETIVEEADPHNSVHISGCRGCGKTSLLKLIGAYLVGTKEQEVYFLEAAEVLREMGWRNAIRMLIEQKREACFLLDETQTAASSIPLALISMLKNSSGHKLTVIGAGVPDFVTPSANFNVQHRNHELFLSKEALQAEGVVGYFGGSPKSSQVLQHIRDHCGGHIYPLMRGMELLQGLPNYSTMTPQEVIAHYESAEFRGSPGYKKICSRVLPPLLPDEIRPLFYSTKEVGALDALRKKGFVSATGNKVLSYLLLDAYVASLGGADISIPGLKGGLQGINEVLLRSLPGLQWGQYDAHGGPVEDALSFELLAAMANIRELSTRLFNPKLVDAGTSGRRPDIYINSHVNSYIECLLTEGHTESDTKSLDEHIDRFSAQERGVEVRYALVEGQDFAVLNFQKTGNTPLNPSGAFSNMFGERVFTFLMATEKIYLGNVPLN